MLFPFFLAAKYLRPRRSWTAAVTFLATLGVVLGVAIIIIVRAVMTGFGDMWREKILAFKPHAVVTDCGGVIRNEAVLAERLRGIDGVAAVSPSVEAHVMVKCGAQIVAPIAIGIATDGLAEFQPELAKSLVAGETSLGDDNVLIGIDLAMRLGAKVGDKILIYSPMNLAGRDELFFPEEMRIGGIFRMGQREYDSGFVICSIGFVRDLLDLPSGAFAIQLKTKNPQDAASFNRIVGEIKNKLTQRYDVKTWREIDREIFTALAVEKNMMAILLMFITVVAMFCVTNTLIVITVSKTGEIGLLKALGFSEWRIMATFVIYGWIQCVVGALIGVCVAFGVLNKLQSLVDFLAHFGVDVFPKQIYMLDEIPWRVTSGDIWEVLVMVVVFCTVASFLPACLAARKDPAEALRS